MNFAKSDAGQFIFNLLRAFGLTPQQWRELDPRDTTFLTHAFIEELERKQRSRREQQMRLRRR